MAFALSWAAVKNSTPAAVRDALCLRGTGEFLENPESDNAGIEMPGGWYVVVGNRGGLSMFDHGRRLSHLGETVVCSVEEHVMYSVCDMWRDRRCVWSVVHDSHYGIRHLEIEGDPPPEFETIRDRLMKDQDDADGKQTRVDCIFDVPVDLAYHVTGYRHSHSYGEPGERPYEVLVSTRNRWWRTLIGP